MITQEIYEIRLGSREYVPTIVDTPEVSGVPYDPTGQSVFMAFPVINVDPVDDDWKVATWTATTDQVGNPIYYVSCLVGLETDIVLDRGDYDVLVKIVDSVESPVMRAGMLRII